MTDITELAQRMKAAAEKATPGRWEYYPGNTSIEYNVDSMDEDQGSIVYVDSGDFTQAQTDRNGVFIALANPANILALVEALEKAQQRIGRLEKKLTDHKRMNQEMAKAMLTPNDSDAAGMEIAALRQRIAELESRTVKLPKRHSMLLREDFNDDYHTEMAYKADEVQASLAAAGIKVEAE
ncbi:TPA: ead/Ea22-like family protein [Klebsiella quasipneumoniae subsp. similipneumoniae]|nr:ead/Ea22-like family protein [Klebsiella quasipneumoniae subsp. similipneumoniae]